MWNVNLHASMSILALEQIDYIPYFGEVHHVGFYIFTAVTV